MVEVFKTNVPIQKAPRVINALAERFPQLRIDLDLEDCDRVLRVEGEHVAAGKIIQLLHANDCVCEVLE